MGKVGDSLGTIVSGFKNVFSGNVGGGFVQISRGAGDLIGGKTGDIVKMGSQALNAGLTIANNSYGDTGKNVAYGLGMSGDVANVVKDVVNNSSDLFSKLKNLGGKATVNQLVGGNTGSSINMSNTINGWSGLSGNDEVYIDDKGNVNINFKSNNVLTKTIKKYADNSGKEYYGAKGRVGVENSYTKMTDKLYISALPKEVTQLKNNLGDEK